VAGAVDVLAGDAVLALQYTDLLDDTIQKGADIASVATITLGNDGSYFVITGVTTITAISARPAGYKVIFRFSGALTLTHNATSLILQGGVNYVTVAGDMLGFISEGAGNWREIFRSKIPVAHSIVFDVTGLRLSGDTATPGNNQVYGTTGAGVKGWKADPSIQNSVDIMTEAMIYG